MQGRSMLRREMIDCSLPLDDPLLTHGRLIGNVGSGVPAL